MQEILFDPLNHPFDACFSVRKVIEETVGSVITPGSHPHEALPLDSVE